MAETTLMVLRVAKLAIVASGLLVVYLAVKGYNRSHSGSLFFLALGIGLITLGSIIEGILFEFFFIGLVEVHAIEAAFQLAGFATVVYSIYQR